MGFGDEIMVSAEARRLNDATGKIVRIVDRHGRPRWNEVWENNPRVAERDFCGEVATLRNGPGCRHYLVEARRDRFVFRAGAVTAPGEIWFDAEELREVDAMRAGRPYVLIEPNVDSGFSHTVNKDWGFERWQAVARALSGVRFVQAGPVDVRRLERAEPFESGRFRRALVALAGAALFVGSEGALHHAAAALRIPAVVVFGAFVSPAVTGYASQRNISVPHPGYPLGCGLRTGCADCRAALDSIPVAEVVRQIEEALAGGGAIG